MCEIAFSSERVKSGKVAVTTHLPTSQIPIPGSVRAEDFILQAGQRLDRAIRRLGEARGLSKFLDQNPEWLPA